MAKQYIILTIFFIFLIQNILYSKTITIYGDDSYPPYSYKKDGKIQGIYVEIMQKAFEQIDEFDLIIKLAPWSEILDKVRKGRALAIFSPYYVKSREAVFIYSEPLVKEEVVIFGLKRKLKGKIKWPNDFYHYNIGLNSGFNYESLGGKKFLKAYNDGKINITESRTNKLNLEKLNANRIDFYLNDKLIDKSDYPKIKRGMAIISNNGHLCFTKKIKKYKFIPTLKEDFDKIIKKMKSNNEIKQIIKRYIK